MALGPLDLTQIAAGANAPSLMATFEQEMSDWLAELKSYNIANANFDLQVIDTGEYRSRAVLNQVLVFTSTPTATATRTITFPDLPGPVWRVKNSTAEDLTLEADTLGATVTLKAGELRTVYVEANASVFDIIEDSAGLNWLGATKNGSLDEDNDLVAIWDTSQAEMRTINPADMGLGGGGGGVGATSNITDAILTAASDYEYEFGTGRIFRVTMSNIDMSVDGTPINIRFSNDGGVTYEGDGDTGTDYKYGIKTSVEAATTIVNTESSGTHKAQVTPSIGNATGEYGEVSFIILDPADASLSTRIQVQSGFYNNTGGSRVLILAGNCQYTPTTALTHFKVFPTSGTFTGAITIEEITETVPLASSTGWDFVARETASSSADIQFLNLTDVDYEYEWVLAGVYPDTADQALEMEVSDDNGVTWKTTSYDSFRDRVTEPSTQIYSSVTTYGIVGGTTAGAAFPWSGTIHALDLEKTGNYKVFNTKVTGRSAAGVVNKEEDNIMWTGGTGAINAVKFASSSGNLTGSIVLRRRSLTGVATGTSGVPSFMGALLKRTTTQSINAATWTQCLWTAETYDTHGFHSNTTNTDRITIPAGVSKVQLHASLLRDSVTARWHIKFYKNGSDAFDGNGYQNVEATGSDNATASTAVLDVVEGDYFTVGCYGDNASVLQTTSSFSLRVVEAVAAQDNGRPYVNYDIASAVSEIVFDNLSPDHIEHRFAIMGMEYDATDLVIMEVSSDNGSTWLSTGYMGSFYQVANGVYSDGNASTARMTVGATQSGNAGVEGNVTVDIIGLTQGYSRYTAHHELVSSSGTPAAFWASGRYDATTVLDAVRFTLASANNIDAGQVMAWRT